MADEEKGVRWWVRYVIVPLLAGGGGIVALAPLFHMKVQSPAPPASQRLGNHSVVMQPPPKQDQQKLPSRPALTEEPVHNKLPTVSPPHLTEAAQTGQAVDVTVWHDRDLSVDALILDGKKPQDGVIVDGGIDSPSTTLKLKPGSHRLSANLGAKACGTIFSVPSRDRVVLRCEN